MNLKGIMQTLGAQPGQVVSNPYVRAFAPTPVVKEAEEPSEDHEVSMANNSLDTIIKMATELKAKMGENEKDIPAWIQDHITNAENYISQASSNYHEYGTNESINEVSYNVKADNAYQFINGAVAVLGMYSRDEKIDSGVKHTLQRVVKDLDGLKKYFFNKKDESVNEGRGIKSLSKELFAVSEKIEGYVEIYKKKKGTPDEKKIIDILKKLNAEKKELEKRMDIEVSSLYRDAELKIESVNEARLMNIVNSIVETPVIGKMVNRSNAVTEAKKYDVGAGFMGNGLTIWNRAEEENNDYRIIAHIDPYGKISIRDKEIPSDVMKMIKDWAEAIKKGDK
jgi:hypothetical protein